VKKKTIWITWENQVRNRSMSGALEVDLFVVLSDRRRLLRYAANMTRTLAILRRERPSVVICQNPSIVLSLYLVLLRPFLGFKLAVDAHYGGVVSSTGGQAVQWVLNRLNRTVDLVIVTNETHANHVRQLGGLAFVCPDPLPDLSRYEDSEPVVPRKVFFICSFDIDEPYEEVFRAASALAPEGFRFFVSGNYCRARISPGDHPEVEFLGFVPEDEFYRHLFSASIVIDLTEHDDCLVCGAYEAMAAGKPTVLSRKPALQSYFRGGTVFTENGAGEIASAIRTAHDSADGLAVASRAWRAWAIADAGQRIEKLGELLDSL
jgi:glycosyltransferase involved in cell wall biosynthesis